MAASFPNFHKHKRTLKKEKGSLFAEAGEGDQRLGKIMVMGKN